jgi:hypothetical protein
VANGEEFYDLTSPAYAQQGDIFPNVPLLSPPPSPELIILREEDGTPWNPRPGLLRACAELSLTAFDDSPEYAAVSAERGLAAVLTQTCDLADPNQLQWLVCPLLSIDDSDIDRGNLRAGKYANLFYMPAHPGGHFDEGFLDLTICSGIRRESVRAQDRVASLSLNAQHSLADKLSETLTRTWGYAPDEDVRISGKYRCVRCFQFYGLVNAIIDLEAGMKFPECPDCKRIKKFAQWRLLRKHEKY